MGQPWLRHHHHPQIPHKPPQAPRAQGGRKEVDGIPFPTHTASPDLVKHRQPITYPSIHPSTPPYLHLQLSPKPTKPQPTLFPARYPSISPPLHDTASILLIPAPSATPFRARAPRNPRSNAIRLSARPAEPQSHLQSPQPKASVAVGLLVPAAGVLTFAVVLVQRTERSRE